MVSKPKSSRGRTTASRRRKPATIDLEAKEVPAKESSGTTAKSGTGGSGSKPVEENTKDEKARSDAAAVSSSQKFGRSQGSGKSADFGESGEKPIGSVPEFSGFSVGPVLSAVTGGLVVVVLLSIAGQFESVRKIPVFGSIFGGGEAPDINAMQSRIQELEVEIRGVTSAPNGAVIEELAARIGAAENALDEIKPALDRLPASGQLETLETRYEELSSVMQSIQSSPNPDGSVPPTVSVLEEFSGRIDQIEARLTDLPDLNLGTVAQDSERLAELETSIEAILQRPQADLESLENRLNNAESMLQTLTGMAEENASILSSLSGKSEALEDQISAAKASEKVARSVAVNSLGAALRNGDALAIPLSSIEALTGVTEETGKLRELSRAGIADLAKLLDGLDALEQKVLIEDEPAGQEGLVNQFLASARKLYTIRPSGPIEGDEPAAVFSRIRAHLENDQLPAVLKEWESLPESVKQQGQEWISIVKNRAEAFGLYQKLSSDLSGSDTVQ